MTAAGGIDVAIGDPRLQELTDAALEQLRADDVAARLAAKDAGLWGEPARAEAAIRLGWLDLPTTSAELIPQVRDLAEDLRGEGLDHIVLAGMGGSSLAPEVITRSGAVGLTILDTTDPGQIRRALADRLDRTVVVVASKSGGTVETDSHRRAYAQAFADSGLNPEQVAARMVVVTDPGSPLEATATEAGYRAVFRADPTVGGRYSALSAFGLVPSGLAGADIGRLLSTASTLVPTLSAEADKLGLNPGLVLGAALGAAARAGRDKLVLIDAQPGLLGFGDWAEQLIAESTGKDGLGILPVVVEDIDAPGARDAGPDAVVATTGTAPGAALSVTGPLGAQFLLWEYATAVAGYLLGINPFDQPNVTESKENTGRLLGDADGHGLAVPTPAFTDGPVQVFGSPDLLGSASTVAAALEALLATVHERGYLAVMAYLDRIGDAQALAVRAGLAERLKGRQVTFGWGPRFLHSTGQYHKGGPQHGAFLQITGAVSDDHPVAGQPYTFGTLHLAQALGDLGALTGRGRPALRLHLTDRAAGLAALTTALGT